MGPQIVLPRVGGSAPGSMHRKKWQVERVGDGVAFGSRAGSQAGGAGARLAPSAPSAPPVVDGSRRSPRPPEEGCAGEGVVAVSEDDASVGGGAAAERAPADVESLQREVEQLRALVGAGNG